MDGEWVVDLPYKMPPLTLNQRLHWATKARRTKDLRLLAKLSARKWPDMEKCQVELVWFVPTRHRRDVDNLVPTLKALCDGLVDAEVVPDDTPEFMVKLMPRIEYAPGVPGSMRLYVKEVE